MRADLVLGRVADRFRSESGPLTDAGARLSELLAEEAPLLPPAEVQRCARQLASELVGLGPLERLLDDPSVTDVLVNGPGPVWVECRGKLRRTAVVLDRQEILRAVERLAGPLGLRADRAHPVADGRLSDGTRVSVVLEPVAVDGPLLALRRHAAQAFALEDLAPPEVLPTLRAAVRRRDNMIVYGPTGSGKTTLLNALAGVVDHQERIVVIEDTAELRLPGEHVVRLEAGVRTEARPKGLTLSDLVRTALRLRPDRIVVGEVRGAEAVDMVWALSTGHRGGMSTVHASNAADALRRIETMMVIGLGEGVPLAAVRQQVRSAVDLLVGVARTADGGRAVVAVQPCHDDDLVETL